ncbi:RidA family protein [Variovorax sp. ZS18.2.2]|uniref:RidA family protein n=1 Tax=Variovorax sp. ZS18.2.2 TaxID=2971255 RepID=UPI002151AD39|nr:RidA family protein [Variovorax sp. ZS18.2.2]MCR6478796.1 RidA family protein [Variovorax sp. ZS18.2.2]
MAGIIERIPLQKAAFMKKEVIRVEPLSTYLEYLKAPASVVTRHGDTVYVSGLPPLDPATGRPVDAPIERQTEIVLDQLKLCLETAGSSLDNVLKCNVYCTSVEKFAAVNAIYARYFPNDPPARIFVCVPAWFGPFDIEIDCIAACDQGAAAATGVPVDSKGRAA